MTQGVRSGRMPGVRAAGLALMLWTGAACAQSSDLARVAELPAHRLLMTVIADNPSASPFATDGCSGGLSTAWAMVASGYPEFAARHEAVPPWEPCCMAHDQVYHVAGGARTAEASWTARLVADEALRNCVLETGRARRTALAASYGVDPERVDAAYAAIAEAMLAAVRLGGAPCSGLPWRWGFGFPNCLRLP